MDHGILFVDDEDNILSALSRELRPWLTAHRLQFWSALSGEQALEFLAGHHQGVIAVVTDMRMPGLAGEVLVGLIRDSWPDIETLVLSGHAELENLSVAVGAGIRGFLTKPWEPEALQKALAQAVERSEVRRKEVLRRDQLLSQSAQVQELQTSLFRRDELDPRRFSLALAYRPQKDQNCGGDFYEVIALDSERCVVLVGDVSGRGVEAAFVTGILHSLVQREEVQWFLVGEPSPETFLELLNSLVFSSLSTKHARHVALNVLFFDRTAEQLTFSSAGGLPLVRVRDGVGTYFHLQGLPLGVADDLEYSVKTVSTKPGDHWFVMTDGVVDRGSDGFVGGEDLVRLAAEAVVSQRGVDGLLDDALGLFPGLSFLDDLTLVEVTLP